MRFSRFATLVAVMVLGCAEQHQNDDTPEMMDDEPAAGGSSAGGGTTSKGGSTSSAGKAANVSGGGKGGSGGMADDGGEGPTGTGGGGAAQGGKTSGGTGGQASGGSGGSGGKATGGAGGSAGSGGSGGSAGTGGSSCTPSTGGPVAGLSARYESEIDATSGTSVGSQLAVYNTSASTFNLADLRVRYYLSNEVQAAIVKNINWAWLRPIAGGQTDIKPAVSFNVVDMTCTTSNADTYFEFTFAANAGLLAPNHYVLFSWSATNGATQSFDQSNDYSFSAGQVIASDYAKVVVLQNSGTKLWGSEP